MERNRGQERAPAAEVVAPAPGDIGLAAVFQSIERLAKEVQNLGDAIGLLVAEVRTGQDAAAEDRLIISQALGIMKDDTDFYQVQMNGAVQRLSDKLTGISNMILHVQSSRAELSDDLILEPRAPRPVPVIIRPKR